jgi:uncharacterized protein YutE (UPF0331/DUF86 family)
MDWLQFTSAIVGHLAWPSVLIVLFIILRKHMGALADRMLEFNFGGAKILFDKALEKGAEIIEQEPLPKLPPPTEAPELKLEPPHIESDDKFRTSNSNRLVVRNDFGPGKSTSALKILDALEQVDNLLFDIGDAMGIDAAEASSVMYSLVAQKKIPRSFLKLYQALREARDVIAHTYALPDNTEADEYRRQAAYLTRFLTRLKSDLEKENSP